MQAKKLFGLAVSVLLAVGVMAGCGSDTAENTDSKEFLNVSYDPTRELYTEFNEKFKTEWQM